MLPIADVGRWWAAFLFGLMLLLLLLIMAWLLRVFVPVVPTAPLSAVQVPAPSPPVGAPIRCRRSGHRSTTRETSSKSFRPSLLAAGTISANGRNIASLLSRPCRPSGGPG